ncbi:MAG: N-acetyltransferase [Planctomycetaceae bacterium]|nr:N-acetyltransferase [Planctomycetaceae bacterium]
MAEPMIHQSAIVDAGAVIGAGARVWHFAHVMPGASIGAGTIVGQNCYIDRDVNIGARCKIQNNVSVYAGVTLEDEVFCGPSMVFTNVINPRAFIERKSEFKPTLVKRGATIGANATIVCGVTIGQYAMIGAGAVVTCDVPDYALMLGVPARRAAWVSRAGHTLPSSLVCPQTGERYRIEAGLLVFAGK